MFLYHPIGTPSTTPSTTDTTKPMVKFVRLNHMCSQMEPLANSSYPLSEDFAEGRKIKRIDDFEAGRELPGAEERKDTEDAQPIG